jgi:hypothetical protein
MNMDTRYVTALVSVTLLALAAVAFCQLLTQREQKQNRFGSNLDYRLPTDAE